MLRVHVRQVRGQLRHGEGTGTSGQGTISYVSKVQVKHGGGSCQGHDTMGKQAKQKIATPLRSNARPFTSTEAFVSALRIPVMFIVGLSPLLLLLLWMRSFPRSVSRKQVFAKNCTALTIVQSLQQLTVSLATATPTAVFAVFAAASSASSPVLLPSLQPVSALFFCRCLCSMFQSLTSAPVTSTLLERCGPPLGRTASSTPPQGRLGCRLSSTPVFPALATATTDPYMQSSGSAWQTDSLRQILE